MGVGTNLSGAKTNYTYDKENRLTGVNAAGSLSTYSSDGDGLRRTAQPADQDQTVAKN
jgi:YD repeat-containing protein